MAPSWLAAGHAAATVGQVAARRRSAATGDLLQGTYAHIAVTDFWRARRSAAIGPAAEAAGARFAHWRAQTADAIEDLAASGSLTPLGEEFIDGMRASIAPMLNELVSAPRPRTGG